jgi:N-acetylglucosamine-6-phosphate deacetylase
MLGGRPIAVRAEAAFLRDGTLAGSTLTMDGAFRTIVERFGLTLPEASVMCSTAPARHLGLRTLGELAAGRSADVVVLDRALRVRRTFIDGLEAFRSG